MLKKITIITVAVAVLGYGTFAGLKSWVKGLLPEKSHFTALKETKMSDLPYVTENIPDNRGKILAVVTSISKMGKDKETGYEHTELARAYWVFIANGFEVDIASPKGGRPPVVIDGEDMGAYDYAFLNEQSLQDKVNNSIPLAEIDANEYEAVYYVGGKGTMFDFPDNPHIQEITKTMYQNDKVVSAVCHGPAALLNVKLDNGQMLLANKRVSGFTNEEELFIIPEAREIFPFLLEDKLNERGAYVQLGTKYLEKVVQDGKLITGQNPWSVWKMAEMVVAELGYVPKTRILTPEENSIALLMTYDENGVEAASEAIKSQPQSYQRILIVMHGILAFMEFEFSKGIDIFYLASELKRLNA